MPTTPLDAYDTLQSGRLGKDFAVLKMKQGTVFQREEEDISRIYQEVLSNFRYARWPPYATLARTRAIIETSKHYLAGYPMHSYR